MLELFDFPNQNFFKDFLVKLLIYKWNNKDDKSINHFLLYLLYFFDK